MAAFVILVVFMVATTLHFPDTWVQISGIISMIIAFKSPKCQGNPKETTDRPTFFSTKEQVKCYFIHYRILPTYYQSWTTAVDRWVDTSNCGQEINDFMTVVKSKWLNFTQSAYVIKSLCSRGLLLKNLSCLPRYTETFNLSSLALLIYEASQFKKKVLLLKKSIVCRI